MSSLRLLRRSARRAAVTAMRLGLACALASILAACAQFTTAQPGPYYPNLGVPASPTATFAPMGYTVAAWPANSEPTAGVVNTIYVAFRDQGSPVPGAQVTLYVQSGDSARPFGPHITDATGYAAIDLSGLIERPNQPVLVGVTVTYESQTYTATTDFTPAP